MKFGLHVRLVRFDEWITCTPKRFQKCIIRFLVKQCFVRRNECKTSVGSKFMW